ncbi:MAG: hypothetical protein HY854_21400 [Burkholderiales bacterium]|nr:hypothetical protein [Burkholderiales bacterium]
MNRHIRRLRWGLLAASLAATQCAFAQPDGPEPERVVKDAPYCAGAVHESVQVLADGNRIVQRQPSRLCRDGQGRTRQEVGTGERRHVYLRDPVANEAWMLDAERKRAMRIGPHRFAMPMDWPHRPPGWEQKLADFSREMREWGREMRDWGRDLGERMRSGRPAASAPQPPATPTAPAVDVEIGSWPKQVRIVVDGVEVAGLPPLPPSGMVPPGVAWHSRMRPPRGPGVTAALPAETIEGLKAEGKRTTWTIPAGRIGNEKPIVAVREVWTSPELGITLRTRESDPLAGEESYRVHNIVRGEPDPALFRVPADYRQSPRTPMPPLPPAKP